MQWINIHTHQAAAPQEWAVQSRYQQFEKLPAAGYFSAGIHPWYINKDWEQQLTALELCSTAPNVLAIGECGLDKPCATDFTLQQQVFQEQVQWAGHLQKPLIIHCVKAFDEVMQLLQKNRVQVPVIFHGFNRNEHIARQLVAKGYYLSFGEALKHTHVQAALRATPANRFFLETDDADTSIAAVYEQAAAVLQIDINALSLQLKKNTLAVFGNSITGL